MKKVFQNNPVMVVLLSLNLIVTSLVLLVIVPKVFASTGCFPDTNGHWAEEYICWLSDNGFSSGYPDGTFRPETRVTRAEMAVMLKNTYDAQESRIADLETLLASLSLENGGDDLVISGVNLHIRNGSGGTNGPTNGLGNLIIGYNMTFNETFVRTGSHNLIIGDSHTYSSYGSIVGGYYNTISAPYTAVLAGKYNTASGTWAGILGGEENTASERSTVSGGYQNTTTSPWASVSGGYNNTASNQSATVSGGSGRTASGQYDWVAGTLFENE